MRALDDIAVIFREALAIHDILGMFVDPANIFVSFAGEDGGHFLVVAKEDGREGAVRVGEIVNMTLEQFELEWNAVVEKYNAASIEERADLLERSHARDQAISIIAGMVDRGFHITSSRSR